MRVARQVQRALPVAYYYLAGANAMKDALAGTNTIDCCHGLAYGCVSGVAELN